MIDGMGDVDLNGLRRDLRRRKKRDGKTSKQNGENSDRFFQGSTSIKTIEYRSIREK
jgi:hypothetical protein